jgi:hypothetical protein
MSRLRWSENCPLKPLSTSYDANWSRRGARDRERGSSSGAGFEPKSAPARSTRAFPAPEEAIRTFDKSSPLSGALGRPAPPIFFRKAARRLG